MNQIRFEERVLQNDFEVSEAIKSVRTAILFSSAECKVISITSCNEGDGKSFLSFSIAKSLSEIGKRVLFIDADMRNSRFASEYAKQTDIKGLSHYLSGQAGVGEVLYSTEIPELYMVFSGIFPVNPAELLTGSAFSSFVAEARENFDYVIIDTPPVNLVTDASICISRSDGSILVLSCGKTPAKAAREAEKTMLAAGKPILGCVLNKVPRRAYKGRYGYGYGYGYGRNDRERNTEK